MPADKVEVLFNLCKNNVVHKSKICLTIWIHELDSRIREGFLVIRGKKKEKKESYDE